MLAGTYVYPWDVLGDPAAPARVADLGVDQVTLAAAYHTVRAVTPRHPRHRIVTAPHAAAYFPPDPSRWRGRRLRPEPASWLPGRDHFGPTADALRAVGLRVNAWVVLMHNALLGARHPDVTVENAYGDHYPWALCPAQEEVRDYAVTLVADVVSRYELAAVEAEACGWYGFDHLSSHDKTGGVRLDGADEFLLSLCFCVACAAAYRDVGLDPLELRRIVVAALEPAYSDHRTAEYGNEWDLVERRLGCALATAVLAARRTVGDRLRAEVARAADEVPLLVHADPRPYRCGANVGLDVDTAFEHAAGLVLAGSAVRAADDVREVATEGRRTIASFVAVTGLGGPGAELPARVDAAVQAGATELRFYHAGLAAARDLDAIKELMRR
jgi:hypothetical protein